MSGSVQPSLVDVLTEFFRALRTGISDPYRPELYYMRGPGPKWRQKHEANALGDVRRRTEAWVRGGLSNDAHAAAS